MLQSNSSRHEFFHAMNPETLVSYIERSVEAGETTVYIVNDGAMYVFHNKEQNGLLRQSNAGYWYFSFTDSTCNYACAFDTLFDEDKRYQGLVYRLLAAFVGK